jgi:hypothetical protein
VVGRAGDEDAYGVGQLLRLVERYDGVAVGDLNQLASGQQVREPVPVLGRHHLVLRSPNHQGRLVEGGQPA